MERPLFVFVVTIVALALGCGVSPLDSIQIPDNLELDVDQDGKSDFQVIYSRYLGGDPIGNYEIVRMTLECTDSIEVLKKDNELPLFLNSLDSVQTQVSFPLFWEVTNPALNRVTAIAQVRTDYGSNTWNDQWEVFSLEEKESYLIGFKVLKGSSTQLGYIEFAINKHTGDFIFMDAVLI